MFVGGVAKRWSTKPKTSLIPATTVKIFAKPFPTSKTDPTDNE